MADHTLGSEGGLGFFPSQQDSECAACAIVKDIIPHFAMFTGVHRKVVCAPMVQCH